MDAVYSDRNNLVQLCAVLAAKCGYKAGVRLPVEDSQWPVVTIQLPDVGEVAWHIKADELFLGIGVYNLPYDGHTGEEKEARIKSYVEAEQGKMITEANKSVTHG